MPCNTPLTITVRGHDYQVPCRWCMGCRIDRRNEWNNRIRWEMSDLARKGFRSSFCTLTYDENHYQGGVCKRDIVNFVKRLREHLSRNNDIRNYKQFKYYIVSELGENTSRGHYHAIFLGLECAFLSNFLRKTWRFGFCDCKPLIPARISYTLKYMDKQIFDSSQKIELDAITTIPFSLKSKGIGATWLKREAQNSLESGVLWSNNHYIKFPSYFANKFGVDREMIKLKMQKALEKKAKENHLSVDDYIKRRSVANEKQGLSRARLSGHSVNDSHLKTAESYLDNSKKGKGIKLAKEVLNYDNE